MDTTGMLMSMKSNHGDFDPARPIDMETLDIVLRAAVAAPTASNLQQYSIIVVRDKSVMERLGFGHFRKADVMLVYNADFRRLALMFKASGARKPALGLRWFLTSLMDVMFCARNAAIAAHSFGIDSCFSNGLLDKLHGAVTELDIPEMVLPVGVLFLGYPPEGERDRAKRGRLFEEGIIMHGRYSDYSSDRLRRAIERYNDPREGFTIPPLTEGMGDAVKWIAQKWLRMVPPDDDLLKALERAGFARLTARIG